MSAAARPDLQRFLDRLTRRSALSEEERRAILALPGYPVQVQANRDFVRIGDRVDHACLVVDGFVGRFGQSRDGARQITSFYIAGDMADLQSVVQPQLSSTLQALSTATILRVPHTALRALAGRYPAIAEAFWRDCMVDAAILCEWVVNVGRRDARARLAHLLCEVATRWGTWEAEHMFFPFPITQAQLADALGLTSVHVNRTLKTLREEGVAVVYGRTVHVLDRNRLAAIGEFDPFYLQLEVEPQPWLRLIYAS